MHFRHFIWQRVVWLRNTSHKFVCGKGLALLVNTVLRVGAIQCVSVLRLILHHPCAAFCTTPNRSIKVFVGGLQVMLPCHLQTVANPLADDMRRKRFFQFRLSGR